MILTDLFESPEIHNQDRLDQVLARCIEMVHEKNAANPKKYGRVAACIIDMKNRKVFGINSPGADGRRRHAERVAIDAYHKRYGKILPGAIIVTTLSPCNRDMLERDGPSCQDLLLQAGIEKVYSGYMDPSQHSEHPFTEEVTKNDDLWRQCKELSDSFVHDDLTEGTETHASAEQVWDYVSKIHPEEEQGGGYLKSMVMQYPQYELKRVPLSSLRMPDQEYDDEEQEPEQDPYNRVQVIDPEHAGEYSANFVDSRPIVVDAEGWIIDGNHRAWAAAELLNKHDIKAWVPASQLNELGNAPADYKPNRQRSRSLFHATVDGQWVDVFFDRSEFNGTLHITFAVNGDYDAPSQPTSASKSTVRILSTVLNIVKKQLPEYMAKARPPAISFTSKQDSRTSLYRKYFVPVIQNILGAKWQHEEYPSMGMTVFHWKPVKKSGVTEVVNKELWHPERIFNQRVPIGAYEFEAREAIGGMGDYDADALTIIAYDPKKKNKVIGNANFVVKGRGSKRSLVSDDTYVDPKYRGEGIATMMYAYANSLGNDIKGSNIQTPMGKKMWANWGSDAKHLRGVAEDAQLPGDFKLMGQNLFLKNLARNLKQRYPDATVKLSSDRVTAYHNEGDDEALSVMGTEVMDSGYIGVGLDDAFTESFQGVLVPTIKQTTEQLLAANPGTRPALFLSTDNWNPDAWTHIATKLGYRLVADDESLDENFADGKGPGRPGDSVRHGIPKKATMAELEKASHAKGRKGQLARWQLNMRRGRKKTNEVTVGVLNLGEFAINVDDHAFERAQQRKINLADIDTVLRKIKLPRVIKKIMDIDVGNRFYVLDHVTDVALGFRRIGDKKLVLKTVYSGRPMDLNIAGIITV